MILKNILMDAGLSDGESRVYLSLLELGSSTTGPIVESSGIARSFVYNVLSSLVEKGLASYITKQKTKHYQAADPSRILYLLEKRSEELEAKKSEIERVIPRFRQLRKTTPRVEVEIYEGYRGIKTAFENHLEKLEKGDENLTFGHPHQEFKYDVYWKNYHRKRAKLGIRSRMLFDKGTDRATMKNRNSYRLCDTRFMPTNIKTRAWFFIYSDTVTIFLQEEQEMAIEIVNKKIADTFRGIFTDYWDKSKPFGSKSKKLEC